jgi:uncharacterized membrane protein
VRELQRAGGFNRRVLRGRNQGTGWVNPRAVTALEYLHAGDTAVAAMQYSYLPSWLSFVVDAGARPRGRARAVPPRVRPMGSPSRRSSAKLFVFGESLGAFGADAAFSGIDDIRTRTDRALHVGPANGTALWRRFVRTPGSGQPPGASAVSSGRRAFGATAADLNVPTGAWTALRMVYLQQPSDPVVW